MTQPRPVRYRCELHSQLELDSGGAPIRARLLELSETGGFVEEVAELGDVQAGEGAMIGVPMPGGDPWVAHLVFARHGAGRVEVRVPRIEHLTVTVPGYAITFDQLDDDALERLRDFLDLLDTR